MNTRLRLLELGLVGVVALGGAARAEPTRSHADGAELNYVLFRDDQTTSMSGNMSDIERARKFKQPNEQVLWFRDGGQEYVVRDPATLKQALAIWKPVEELGEQQGKLGSQQGELGRQQGELGSQQGLLGTRQGTLSVREATLSMRESNDSLSDADRASLAKQRHELHQQIRALAKQMRALDKPMRELGDKMGVLGREMGVLGEKMGVASRKANADMRELLKRSIASGIAKPVK